MPEFRVLDEEPLPPQAKRLLDAIATGESPDYDVIYGGGRFTDYSRHPGVAVPIGRGKTSSAAGRYQFLRPTWERAQQALGLPDFSPDSQDRAAWWLAQETYRGAGGGDLAQDLDDPNKWPGIARALRNTWTSLPGGPESTAGAQEWADRLRGGPDEFAVIDEPAQPQFRVLDEPSGGPQAGNIDLTDRPVVRNADGSISTVRSMSFNEDGREILVPTVSDDGLILNPEAAIAQYHRTGRHLGIFADAASATAYAEQLHRDQEQRYDGSAQPGDIERELIARAPPPRAQPRAPEEPRRPSTGWRNPIFAIGQQQPASVAELRRWPNVKRPAARAGAVRSFSEIFAQNDAEAFSQSGNAAQRAMYPHGTATEEERRRLAARAATLSDPRENILTREELPLWNGPNAPVLHGDAARAANLVAAFAGQLTGSARDPINLLGGGGKTIGTRLLTNAGVNAASDAATQGLDVVAGIRENYDPLQTAAAGGIGALLQVPGEILRPRIAPRVSPQSPAPAPRPAFRVSDELEPVTPRARPEPIAPPERAPLIAPAQAAEAPAPVVGDLAGAELNQGKLPITEEMRRLSAPEPEKPVDQTVYSNPFLMPGAKQRVKQALHEVTGGEHNRRVVLAEINRAVKSASPKHIVRSVANFTQMARGADIGAIRMFARRHKNLTFNPNEPIPAGISAADIGKNKIEWIADRLGSDPGSGRVIGQPMEPAAGQRLKQVSNRLPAIFKGLSEAEYNSIADEVSMPSMTPRAPAKLSKAATEIRALLRNHLEYMREAGVDVGDQGPDYFPRPYSAELVRADEAGFVDGATKLYKLENPGIDDVEARARAEAWANNILFPYSVRTAGFAATMGSPNHTKERVHGPDAERLLGRFMVRDPLTALNRYFAQTTMIAEHTRRFGRNGETLENVLTSLQRQMPVEDWRNLVDHIESARGLSGPSARSGNADLVRGAMSWVQLGGTLRLLGRTGIAQFFQEPFNIAIRANYGPLGMLRVAGTQLDTYVGVSRSSKRWKHTANLLGIIGDMSKQILLDAHTQGIADEIPKRIASAAFDRNLTLPVTEAERITAARIGDAALRAALDDMVGPRGQYAKGAESILGEYGINRETAPRVQSWLDDLDKMPADARDNELAWGTSPEARLWRAALHDFATKSILEPTAADTPHFAKQAAKHPMLHAAYAITSFMYGATREFRNRALKQAWRGATMKGADLKARYQLMAPLLTWVSAIGAAMLVDQGRRAIFSPQHGREQSEVDKLRSGLSQAQVFGTFDPIVNFLAPRTRYDKTVGGMVGPDYVLDLTGNIEKMAGVLPGRENNPDTNSTEHAALRGAYAAIAAPAIGAALSLAPIPTTVAAPGIMYGTSSRAADDFATAIVGPSDAKKKPKFRVLPD